MYFPLLKQHPSNSAYLFQICHLQDKFQKCFFPVFLLQLEDVESGDLIKTDSEEDKEPTTGQVIIARWNWQRQNYYLD